MLQLGVRWQPEDDTPVWQCIRDGLVANTSIMFPDQKKSVLFDLWLELETGGDWPDNPDYRLGLIGAIRILEGC